MLMNARNILLVVAILPLCCENIHAVGMKGACMQSTPSPAHCNSYVDMSGQPYKATILP